MMGIKRVAACLTGAALIVLSLPLIASAATAEKTVESAARAAQEQPAEEPDQPDRTSQPGQPVQPGTPAAEADETAAPVQSEQTFEDPAQPLTLYLDGRDVTGGAATIGWTGSEAAKSAPLLKAVAADGQPVAPEFLSSDAQVVTVDPAGLVVPAGYGVATVTATFDGQTAACEITVGHKIERLVIISEDTVSPGRSIKLRAFDQDGNRVSAVWRSSSEKLARVSADGVLTASRAAGGRSVDVTALAGEDSEVSAVKTIEIG